MSKVGVLQKARALRAVRVGVVVVVLLGSSMIHSALSSAANDQVHCNGVFNGGTPVNVSKTADKSEAIPGETVTYTFTWDSTGTDLATVIDCFRVDDGSDNALNSIVEVSNFEKTDIAQTPGGTPTSVSVPVQIPDDAALIGHTVADRGKLTKGSIETRTNILEVSIVAPPSEDGTVDGSTDDGTVDGSTDDGTVDGSTDDGTVDGSTDDGTVDGTTDDGTVDGSTDDGTVDGSTDDGTVDGSTDDGTVVDGTTDGSGDGSTDGTEVLGNTVKQAPLATTGSETTTVAWLGAMFLMAGCVMRFVKIPSFDARGSATPSTQDMLSEALRRSDRNGTCSR